MNKDEYILRSISKIPHKKWELLVITRIVHAILDKGSDLEFVCQQLVRRPEGRRSLTDIYFPQLKLHLEVKESYHSHKDSIIYDECREKDIVSATGHEIKDIKIYRENGSAEGKGIPDVKPLPEIICEVDNFISYIFQKRQELVDAGRWEGWDFGRKFDPENYLEIGHLDISDSPVFRTHRDALRCFGYAGGNYQRATWTIKGDEKKVVWFPKFYKNNDWDNSISDDGQTIQMTAVGSDIAKNFDATTSFKNETAVVFAHYTDALGITLYRYLGEFQKDAVRSKGLTTVLKRTSTRTTLRL
jgi:hypothetical protein